jgi:hypothetical protein
MKRFLRLPSPAMVVAIIALVVASSGVSYAVATISGSSLVNGSIRNVKFKDGTLRGQEAKRDGFGGGAIKERSLDASQLDASKIGQVPSAASAEGVVRHVVVASNGGAVRGRGVTSTAKTGVGQYQAIFDRDVRNCTYFATLGDESAAAPGTGQISVTSAASNVNGVRVVTRNSAGDTPVDRSFHLMVSC